jgi:hypothetical protein
MASLHHGQHQHDESWARDQEDISILLLASELVIEQFVVALRDEASACLNDQGREPMSQDAHRLRHGPGGTGPTLALEGWDAAMAARCAILLQRELKR